jgi:hypothetical protein
VHLKALTRNLWDFMPQIVYPTKWEFQRFSAKWNSFGLSKDLPQSLQQFILELCSLFSVDYMIFAFTHTERGLGTCRAFYVQKERAVSVPS